MDFVEKINAPESLQDDAVLAPLQEVEEEPIPTIEEAMEEQAESEGDSAAPEEPHVTKPQSMKVRMEAYETRGYKRGKEEAEKAFAEERQQFESRLAKLQEYELREEAAKLAKEENISESIALRLLRAERGIPAAAEEKKAESTQPRDASGRFVSTKQPAENRTDELFREAQLLEKAMGISVSELLDKASEDDKQALVSGDMDMAEFVRKNAGSGRRTPSVTTRASSGGTASRSFENMSDAQWEALNNELARGRKFRSN